MTLIYDRLSHDDHIRPLHQCSFGREMKIQF